MKVGFFVCLQRKFEVSCINIWKTIRIVYGSELRQVMSVGSTKNDDDSEDDDNFDDGNGDDCA